MAAPYSGSCGLTTNLGDYPPRLSPSIFARPLLSCHCGPGLSPQAERGASSSLQDSQSEGHAILRQPGGASRSLKQTPPPPAALPSGAAAIYGLRNLVPGFSAPVVQVAGVENPTYQTDFYAVEVGGVWQLQDMYGESLASWLAGAGQSGGRVTTWYDQSGNSAHASAPDPSTGAAGPFLVPASTQPGASPPLSGFALAFRDGQSWLNLPAPVSSVRSAWAVFCPRGYGAAWDQTVTLLSSRMDPQLRLFPGSAVSGGGTPADWLANSTANVVFLNGTFNQSTAPLTPGGWKYLAATGARPMRFFDGIGRGPGERNFDGWVSELALYPQAFAPSDASALYAARPPFLAAAPPSPPAQPPPPQAPPRPPQPPPLLPPPVGNVAKGCLQLVHELRPSDNRRAGKAAVEELSLPIRPQWPPRWHLLTPPIPSFLARRSTWYFDSFNTPYGLALSDTVPDQTVSGEYSWSGAKLVGDYTLVRAAARLAPLFSPLLDPPPLTAVLAPNSPPQSYTEGLKLPGGPSSGYAVVGSQQYFGLPFTVSVLFRPDAAGSRLTSVAALVAGGNVAPCSGSCAPVVAFAQPAAGQPFGVVHESSWWSSANTDFPANQFVFPASPQLAVGQWQRLTVVFQQSGTVQVFRSGTAGPVASGGFASPVPSNYSFTPTLAFAQLPSSDRFAGAIASAQFYFRALAGAAAPVACPSPVLPQRDESSLLTRPPFHSVSASVGDRGPGLRRPAVPLPGAAAAASAPHRPVRLWPHPGPPLLPVAAVVGPPQQLPLGLHRHGLEPHGGIHLREHRRQPGGALRRVVRQLPGAWGRVQLRLQPAARAFRVPGPQLADLLGALSLH